MVPMSGIDVQDVLGIVLYFESSASELVEVDKTSRVLCEYRSE